MDRSWIFGTQFTPAYINGVQEFMDFVSARFPQGGHVPCPCTRCVNLTWRPQPLVHDHILIHGMAATYTRWIHHGEPADAAMIENLEQGGQGNHHDEGIQMDVDDDDYDEDFGVPEMLGELYAAAEADGEKPKFAKVLEDAKKALIPGSKHSKFSFMVRLLYMKSRYRICNTAFTTMMTLISDS